MNFDTAHDVSRPFLNVTLSLCVSRSPSPFLLYVTTVCVCVCVCVCVFVLFVRACVCACVMCHSFNLLLVFHQWIRIAKENITEGIGHALAFKGHLMSNANRDRPPG